jgi:hypothetical protein
MIKRCPWYDPNTETSRLLAALEQTRRLCCNSEERRRDSYALLQKIKEAIDDYAECEMEHREYFWGRPHSAGCKLTRDGIPVGRPLLRVSSDRRCSLRKPKPKQPPTTAKPKLGQRIVALAEKQRVERAARHKELELLFRGEKTQRLLPYSGAGFEESEGAAP